MRNQIAERQRETFRPLRLDLLIAFRSFTSGRAERCRASPLRDRVVGCAETPPLSGFSPFGLPSLTLERGDVAVGRLVVRPIYKE
jgi:hypothetical protein